MGAFCVWLDEFSWRRARGLRAWVLETPRVWNKEQSYLLSPRSSPASCAPFPCQRKASSPQEQTEQLLGLVLCFLADKIAENFIFRKKKSEVCSKHGSAGEERQE